MKALKNNLLNSKLIGAEKVAVAGHIRPDGDCIGSCLALYQYLENNKADFKIKQIDMYLETFGNEFRILEGVEEIKHSYDSNEVYDLFISLDCGSLDRLGGAMKYFLTAKDTINIDHHISNNFFAKTNHVITNSSSTCEVLYDLFDKTRITKEIAEDLYVGIINDTGVFKHSNTTGKTMVAAAKLIERGIDFSNLIDEAFLGKTYMQNQLLGRCLMESLLILDGKVIVSSANRKLLDFYGASHSDLEGIIDQLRATKGTEVAIFIYESDFKEFKVSLRSNGEVDVSRIAVYFGGGGHIKAAGCTMRGSAHDVINNLTGHIEAQLKLNRDTEGASQLG